MVRLLTGTLGGNNFFQIFYKKILQKQKRYLFLHSQKKRSVGKAVNTPPFHGGITGSIPVRSTGKGIS
jgi:hypothetical protein